jgi:hypothetical protein
MFDMPSSHQASRQPIPPHPDTFRWFARALLCLLLALQFGGTLLRPPLRAWAVLHHPSRPSLAADEIAWYRHWAERFVPAAVPTAGELPDPFAMISTDLARFAAALVLDFYTPERQHQVRTAAAVGLSMLLLELLVVFVVRLWAGRPHRTPTHVYQVRTLHPRRRPHGTPDPEALWTQLMAVADGRTALTLTRMPNAPTALGLRITAAPDAAAALLQRLRAVLRSHDALVQITPCADPLADAAADEVVRHCTFHVRAPAHLPLAETPTRLVAALATALVLPPGIRYAELQTIPTPEPTHARTYRQDLARRTLARLEQHRHAAGSDATRHIRARQHTPLLHMTLRLVVVAERSATAAVNALRQQVATALSPLQTSFPRVPFGTIRQQIQPGSFRRSRSAWERQWLRRPLPLPPPTLLLPRCWPAPLPLSAVEAGALWSVPVTEDADLLWQPNRILPPPPSVCVPPDAPDWLILGRAPNDQGELIPVGLPFRALHEVLHITAGMGAGKSQVLANMCEQLIPQGFILLDGKGDDTQGLATAVRSYVPYQDESRLILIDVLDTAWPVALNPLYDLMRAMEQGDHATHAAALTQAMGLIMGLFEQLDPERWQNSPGMQQYALMSGQLVLHTGSTRPGHIPTIARVARVMDDDAFRADLLQRYPSPGDDVYRFWTERHAHATESQRSSMQALLRRLDLFLQNPITRTMLTIERPTVDVQAAMAEGRIVIIPFPHRRLAGLAPLVGMFLLATIIGAAYARPGDARSRRTVPLIIDELQVFLKGHNKDLRDAITQLRGFGIGGIYAHQSIAQLGDLRDEMLTNSASRLMLRTEEPDASVYARKYDAYGITAADISMQPARQHFYAAAMQPDIGAPALFSVVPDPWPDPVPADYQILIRFGDGTVPWSLGVLPTFEHTDPEVVQQMRSLYRVLARLVYSDHTPERYAQIVGQLALLPDDQWDALLDAWQELREYQRTTMLNRIGIVRERMERQVWLSRLESRACGLLADAAYQRERWAHQAHAPLDVPKRAPSTTPTTMVKPAQSALIPGLASDDPAPPPQVERGPDVTTLLRERARRPSSADIADGYTFGAPAVPPPPEENPDDD